MFVLRKRDGSIFYLQRGKTYVIGRKGADILIQDQSVSKIHAKLNVNNTGRIFIEDLKSSNKTFINNQPLTPANEVEFKIGSEIKFGIHNSIYVLQKCDDFIVTISGLSSTEKKRIEQMVLQLPGQILNQWSPTCTHVVIERLILSVKVLAAFVNNQQIVTPQYFEELLLCIKDNKSFPNADAFRPSRREIQNSEVDFTSNRKKLFSMDNKVFVFPDEQSKKTLLNVIVSAGGKAIVADSAIINKKDLLKSSNEYIFVINEQHSQRADTYFNKLLNYLKGNGRRAIPTQEIALAILHCSCEYYCNTLFDKEKFIYQSSQKVMDTPSSSEILAHGTQSQLEENSKDKSVDTNVTGRIIPPTLESNVDLDDIIDVDEYVPSNAATLKRVGNSNIQEKIGKKPKLDIRVSCTSGVLPLKKNTSNNNSTLLDFFNKDDKPEDAVIQDKSTEIKNNTATKSMKIASDCKTSIVIKTSTQSEEQAKENVALNNTAETSKRLSDETLVNTPAKRIKIAQRNPFITKAGLSTTTVESQNSTVSNETVNNKNENPFGKSFTSRLTQLQNNKDKFNLNIFSSTCVDNDQNRSRNNDLVNDLSTISTENRSVIKKKSDHLQKITNLKTVTSSAKEARRNEERSQDSLRWYSKQDLNDITLAIKNLQFDDDIDDDTMGKISQFIEKTKSWSMNVKRLDPKFIDRRATHDLNYSDGTVNSTTEINFKKFRKIKPLREQTEIIDVRQMKRYLCNFQNIEVKDEVDSDEESPSNMSLHNSSIQTRKATLSSNVQEDKFVFPL